MPQTMDDQTTTRIVNRSMRLAYENYVMSSRTITADYQSTETPLRLPVQPFYLGATDIGAIFKQIIALINGEESDDEGRLRPTQYALDRMALLLLSACKVFPIKFPAARVAPDLDGGLRIEWRSEKGVVRLVVPPADTQREYIYVRINGESLTEFSLSGEVLSFWLQKVA